MLNRLLRGDARRYLLGFYGSLAYGMTRDTYSGVECTSAETGANGATLPHTYSCSRQLEMLRAMLVREDGGALVLGDAIPRPWLADGRAVAVAGAPTRFGDVSFRVTSQADAGRITVVLDPPRRVRPEVIRLRLRHPRGRPIGAVTVNGVPWLGFSGEVIELRPAPAARVTIAASYGP
jgi:hypothetical protein